VIYLEGEAGRLRRLWKKWFKFEGLRLEAQTRLQEPLVIAFTKINCYGEIGVDVRCNEKALFPERADVL
jgi:hypothetical protein